MTSPYLRAYFAEDARVLDSIAIGGRDEVILSENGAQAMRREGEL